MHSSDFDYHLPLNAIAQEAIEPRDAARLLVVRTLEHRTFLDLPNLLDPGDLLVVNNTRVRPARISATKETGGRVELLLTKQLTDTTWEALVRPARRVRLGTSLTAGPLTVVVMSEPDRGVVALEVSSDGTVDEVLSELGEIPLPPYFHGTLNDDERYQTMFAREVGSAAAPTAALHFTPRIVEALHARDIGIVDVELEVGLDTFRPMDDGPISDHQMHRERYTVPASTADAIVEAKRRGSRVVAVGTTVVRTLETASGRDGGVMPGSGSTELFVTPGFRTKVIDAVVTNFHAPGTTLVVMIAALIGSGWREVYAHALDSGYRFLSFGDAMFVEVDE
jgi:S-adenosylmethionine:tRNA ribosyltransferase-isomerase